MPQNPAPTQNRPQYPPPRAPQDRNPHSKRKGGGARMRYSSHYGIGGEHLDTRTKSVLLYNHCFG